MNGFGFMLDSRARAYQDEEQRLQILQKPSNEPSSAACINLHQLKMILIF